MVGLVYSTASYPEVVVNIDMVSADHHSHDSNQLVLRATSQLPCHLVVIFQGFDLKNCVGVISRHLNV